MKKKKTKKEIKKSLNLEVNFMLNLNKLKKKKDKIEIINIKTPKLLEVKILKTAQGNRKYHSGLIWLGVTKELAKIKLSCSKKKNGKKNNTKIKKKTNKIIIKISTKIKKGNIVMKSKKYKEKLVTEEPNKCKILK